MVRIKQANTEDSEEWLEPHPGSPGSCLSGFCHGASLPELPPVPSFPLGWIEDEQVR